MWIVDPVVLSLFIDNHHESMAIETLDKHTYTDVHPLIPAVVS